MRHPQHWYFPQFRCNMRKISAKRYRRAKLVVSRRFYICVTIKWYSMLQPANMPNGLQWIYIGRYKFVKGLILLGWSNSCLHLIANFKVMFVHVLLKIVGISESHFMDSVSLRVTYKNLCLIEKSYIILYLISEWAIFLVKLLHN